MTYSQQQLAEGERQRQEIEKGGAGGGLATLLLVCFVGIAVTQCLKKDSARAKPSAPPQAKVVKKSGASGRHYKRKAKSNAAPNIPALSPTQDAATNSSF